MKKTLIGILTTVMVLSIGVTSAFAVSSRAGENFVDADGNGICDNYDEKQNINGKNYIDEDNDGVCDNYNSDNGQGQRKRFRGGRK
ncbi:MAG: hypothetical protein E6441_08675 [Clostridium sp.]|uniref:hypothetical protein n=1 Tax=Clostridium TaxID=1485 RepID=UPI001FABA33E|nr:MULTISPECIES: hypothetical protein [Clostridium]MDU5209327.1 hypothetical protein [Clostridium sp.]MDU6761529.1 hypothetical protein [Clostridium sp.]